MDKASTTTGRSPIRLTHEEARTIEKRYVLHSWTTQKHFDAPTIVGGEGSTFWDIDGKRFLDFSSQAMCNNLGYRHPLIVKAVRDQAEKLFYVEAKWGSLPRALLAKKVVEIAPSNMAKVFFTNAGAESLENAIKIARLYTGRQKIIARYRSYHGASYGAITLSGDPRRWAAEPGIPGVVHVLPCYCYRCPFRLQYPACGVHCVDHIDQIIEWEGPQNVAAIVVEPIVGSNGLLVPPDEYMPRLRQVCDKYDILFIADEVMTGFGRTGRWFAVDHWNVKPDIIACAKGLTAANVPLGAVIVSERISEYFEENELTAGLTYSGHPFGCAVGLATLEAYERDNLIQHCAELGEVMLERLREMQGRHPVVGDVRGRGLFATAELVKDRETREPVTPWNTSWAPLKRLLAEGLKRGVSFAARWNFFILAPPLVITEQELDFALDTLDELLKIADEAIAA